MPTAFSRRSYSGGAKATTIAQAVSDAATTITVADASTLPNTGGTKPAAIIINRGEPNEEVVFYGTKSVNILSSCERAADGTVAFSHAVGETVEHVYTAQDADEANAHYSDATASYVPHTQHVHKTVAQTITAGHTWSGNQTHSGTETFSGSVSMTGPTTISTAAITTASGNVAFTGSPTFANATFSASPTMPMGGAPVTLDTGASAAGSSAVPARQDHKHALDMTAILNAVNPAGKVEPFAGATAPSGWLVCNGAAISRATYPALFTAVGTTWGSGDGINTFNLPDFRGKVLTGADGAHALGASGGTLTKTLTTSELPAHAHTVTDGQHDHSITTGGVKDYGNRVAVSSPTDIAGYLSPSNGGGQSISLSSVDPEPANLIVNSTGSGNAFNVEQPWAGVHYIIKAH